MPDMAMFTLMECDITARKGDTDISTNMFNSM